MNAGELAAQTAVAGLASFRLWRLLAVDRILAGPRSWLYQQAARPRRPAVWAVEWLDCPWCSGFWIAGATAWALSWARGTGGWSTVAVWWASAAAVPVLATVTGDAESVA